MRSGIAATADLEAVGDIIKGARHYIAGLLWFASSGAGIVLIKVGDRCHGQYAPSALHDALHTPSSDASEHNI